MCKLICCQLTCPFSARTSDDLASSPAEMLAVAFRNTQLPSGSRSTCAFALPGSAWFASSSSGTMVTEKPPGGCWKFQNRVLTCAS